MSKTSDYRPDPLDHQNNLRAGADLRLRLLTLKDLAHAFLEELGTVGDGDAASAETAEGPIDFYEEVRRFEIELIQSALRRTNGVQTEAATLLGLKPSTLHAKIKLYQLSAADFTMRSAADFTMRSAADFTMRPAAGHPAAHGGGVPRGGYADGARAEYDERARAGYDERAEAEEEEQRVPVLA